MTGMEIIDDLSKAQDLLGAIYHFAQQTGNQELEHLMSAADTMIVEAIDLVA